MTPGFNNNYAITFWFGLREREREGERGAERGGGEAAGKVKLYGGYRLHNY